MIPLSVHHLLAILSFLLTLVFVSSILTSQKPAGSTTAWLLAICIAPYIGIPLYLFFSSRKFKSRRNTKARLYRQPPSGSSVELPSVPVPFQKLLRFSGVPDAKPNRRIELLADGVTAYRRLIEVIRGARRSIHVTTFILSNDSVGNAVVTELAAKARAGLDVRLLVDAMGAAMSHTPSLSPLTEAGGKVAFFMPILHLPFQGRTNLRNHRKLLIADGEVAILGGMNLAEEYMGPDENPRRWVDLALCLEGSCASDLESIFSEDWGYATKSSIGESSAAPTSPERSDTNVAQVVASGPDVPDDPLYDVLFTAINEAETSVQIVTPYFVPDESLAKALELASKRGVRVQILIPRRSNHRLADLARGSFLRQLSSTGVQFKLYPRMIHAKAVIVDSRCILGSANFDMRSLLLNFELGLLVYSSDVLDTVARWMTQRLEEAGPLELKTGFWRELAEGVGRVIGPIL